MQSSRLQFRSVTENDFDDIMTIRPPEEIYQGFDNLPDHFHLLIKSPNTKGYVATIDGKFVAFCFAYIVDDGHTLMFRATRVCKENEGHGFVKALTTYIKQQYSEQVNTCTLTFSTGNSVLMNKIGSGEYLSVCERAISYYNGRNITTAVSLDDKLDSSHCRIISETDLLEIFQQKQLISSLFPENKLIAYFAPFKLISSNIPLICSNICSIFGTFNPECSLLSFAIQYQCCNGVVVHLDIYGDTIIHVTQHFSMFLKQLDAVVRNKEVHIFLTHSRRSFVDDSVLKEALTKFNFRKATSPFATSFSVVMKV